MGCGESFCLAVAQLLLSMQNQALFPCFVSAMLSSVTTELAVAALGSLGCISAGSIAGSFFGWFAGAFHSLVDVLLSQRGLLAALLANHVLAFGSGRMAELCVDWSSCFLPGSLSTLALMRGGCNFQLLWIAKLWGRAVSALQVIQQSTSLDLGREDNSPIIWEPIDFLRELSDINLKDLHNTSLAGEIHNLESLQHLEKLHACITCWQQFSTENKVLSSLCCSQ
ncbi:hypothetical protein BDE02_03G028400 [Populus trichocarpa]|nr:hypothetical protein BDE02_03G028400 [Populus trichocarpa]